MTRSRLVLLLVPALCLALCAACATTPAPRNALDAAAADIRQAQDLGAASYAPVELQRARLRLEEADIAYGQRDYAQADQLAGQARLEAELAQHRSRAATLREQVRAAVEENARLRRELLGEGGQP